MTVGTHKIAVQERESMQTGHISKELFCDWQAGRMKQPEEERFLGHIGVCTFCAGQFGNWMEEGILEITDLKKFKNAMISGIGREKAYGMGLLTVIPM